ncbi:nep-2 [Pristionchus pacificus]|uniref:Nep-2 n=1 Tax=Pristionchus pacificus TaxID=54126 RepID=A0A2A6B729_PRIPA|nr:nep-2 [Pristionchus pacificus]|eukprot:PDM61671.1 nep-2 [Pristionchus pacificus]
MGTARCLGVAVVVLLLLCAALAAALLYLQLSKEEEVCLTSGCIQTASVILSSMNSSVDPCDDFYEYACGEWIKAKQFYRLCLNESEIMDEWRKVFDEVVKMFGGWPSLGPHDPSMRIEKLYATMVSKFKVDSLFKATVQPDDKNSERHVLLLDQPALNLFARDFYIAADNDERLAYMTLIRDVLVLLKADAQTATRDAAEIIEFETALANITMAEEQRHDIAELYTKMTLGQMTRELPYFNWKMFFNEVFADIKTKNGTDITFDDTTEVVVYGVEFLRRLDKLLPQFHSRLVYFILHELKVVNYLSWCWFFKTMLRDLPDPFSLTIFKFYKSLNLLNVQKVRWHGCVTRINSLMPMATSSIYVKNHFDHEAKEQVEEMISLIMEAFTDLLESEDWLTPETKAFAKQKVQTMKQKIGYPDYLNDSGAVDVEYNSFIVYPGDYYRTKFKFYEMYQKDVLERIVQAVDRER